LHSEWKEQKGETEFCTIIDAISTPARAHILSESVSSVDQLGTAQIGSS
jgi:hypothetical protein